LTAAQFELLGERRDDLVEDRDCWHDRAARVMRLLITQRPARVAEVVAVGDSGASGESADY
jgi:hypothetical protein